MDKLIRITTIPLSLEKLLEDQLTFMNQFYEVTAISGEKERLKRYGKVNGVKTFWVEMTRTITPLSDFKAVWKLYNFFKKTQPFIVHTHTPKAGIVGMLAAKLAGVPHRLHTVAGMPLMETTGVKRNLLNFVEKLTYSLATKVYPNSRGLKDVILAEEFAAEEKLKVLGKGSSNGIDTSYFDPGRISVEERNQFKINTGIPGSDLVFVFVGRLVSEKGINELVQAFVKLQKENPEISLLMVGPYEQDLDPISRENLQLIEQHPKIFTTGYQVDVRSYFAISDVLVFPSYREGFPNVVLQAGAMNLPSIVSNINGCNEIIVEGINGMIIPPKDQDALFKAMKLVAENGDYRERLASNARNEICRFYERKEFWQILLNEYKSLEKEGSKA
ncbi:glycosyltransferase family 4 protein [Salegentibacter sp. HM20]